MTEAAKSFIESEVDKLYNVAGLLWETMYELNADDKKELAEYCIELENLEQKLRHFANK